MRENKADVGVIIGRFQVHELHQAHRELFQLVSANHDKVICILGMAHTKSTKRDPLDFQQRKAMLESEFPEIVYSYQKDQSSDEVWSEQIDATISDLITPSQTVMLYGSRDSFLGHYLGVHSTTALEPSVIVSGSELRRTISNEAKSSPEFRAGAIWATSNQYQSPVMTVDIVPVAPNGNSILLCKKSGEQQLRFVGGFVDTQESLEQAALRELEEETGIKAELVTFVTSQVIKDWRYRAPGPNILSSLFATPWFDESTAEAKDDIESLYWVTTKEIRENKASGIVPEHRALMSELLKKLEREKTYE